MGNIGWAEVKDKGSSAKTYKKGGGSSDLFVKLPEGDHTIRLVGEPHKIYIAWIKDPETGKNEKFLVPQKGGFQQRLKNLGVDVREYFATNCFVLGDEKTRLRILEKGRSIFDSFANWYQHFTYPKNHPKAGQNINPGGVDGPNFLISAEAPVGKNANQRISYNVIALQQTPFTKEQLEVLKRGKVDVEKYADLPLGERGLIDLQKYYDEERAAERLKKKLQELAGITVDDSGTEDAPISSGHDDDEESSGSDDIGDLLGEETTPSVSASSSDEDSDEDVDLLKQAEKVLGELF